MKAIMISAKPIECVNIMKGKQTIDVRKNKALANAIQKLIKENGYADIYVYCSKDNNNLLCKNCINKWSLAHNYPKNLCNPLEFEPIRSYNGKVVFKFHCYKIEEIKPKVILTLLDTFNTYETETLVFKPLLKKCCLSYSKLDSYLKRKIGYAIHISDLEIFDKSKELWEFKTPENTKLYKADLDEAYNDECGNSVELTQWVEGYYGLQRAPQNFCYIEV